MTRPFLPALPITILSQNADAIRTALHTAMKKNSCLKAGPEVVIRQATDTPSQINCDAVEVMIADPDLAAQIIPDCTNLTWCQNRQISVKLLSNNYADNHKNLLQHSICHPSMPWCTECPRRSI